jgi:hypothetical protein
MSFVRHTITIVQFQGAKTSDGPVFVCAISFLTFTTLPLM